MKKYSSRRNLKRNITQLPCYLLREDGSVIEVIENDTLIINKLKE